MVDYIDQHREDFGVESICNELPIASSTYYAARTAEPCERARRDIVMMPILMALFIANYRVYGARKLWIAAKRAGHDIGRDQVARLMTVLDIEGVTRRRKRVWTTRSDGGPRSPDLVERNFTAAAPNQLWVTDLTYEPTWSGVAYVAFIVDVYSRMIVGWRVAARKRTDMVRDPTRRSYATDLRIFAACHDHGIKPAERQATAPRVVRQVDGARRADGVDDRTQIVDVVVVLQVLPDRGHPRQEPRTQRSAFSLPIQSGP
jgi:hypothetical protein